MAMESAGLFMGERVNIVFDIIAILVELLQYNLYFCAVVWEGGFPKHNFCFITVDVNNLLSK